MLLNLDSPISCGLILNELISNSLKYAFKARESGHISIGLKESENDQLILINSDDGTAIGGNINIYKKETLGLQVLQILINQLEGHVKLHRENGSGLEITSPKFL